MNFDFTKTLVNGIKFWTKEYVQDEISKMGTSGDADPIMTLSEIGFVDPTVNENNLIYTDENGTIFSL